jgi:hypothetical protein
LGIALAVLLDWVVPVRVLPEAHWLSLVNWVGVVVAVVGFAIEAGAARALASAGTSTRAGAGASVLVTAGPFEWSRNPFYLGLLLVLAGVVLAFSLDWGIVLVPLVWMALDRFPGSSPGDRAARGGDVARAVRGVRGVCGEGAAAGLGVRLAFGASGAPSVTASPRSVRAIPDGRARPTAVAVPPPPRVRVGEGADCAVRM